MEYSDDLKKFIAQQPVDFVIITALEEERDAVLSKLPDHRKVRPSQEDVRVYFMSDLPAAYPDGEGVTYQVVVMLLPGMGRVNAMAATSDAIRRWNPRYVVLVGIAGGVAARGVNLGDILVSDQVVDYELQKQTSEKDEVRWEVYRADQRLLEAARNLGEDDWQESLTTTRPASGVTSRHIGPVASGDKVVAFGDILAKYRDTWPKLVGVEMEAGGAAAAAHQAAQRPGFFMVRGVSDLADEQKGSPDVEKWRSYACDSAASYAIALMRSGPIPPTSSVHTSEAAVLQRRMEAQLDEMPSQTDRTSGPEQTLGQLARSHLSGTSDAEPILVLRKVAPYLRTIEHQEEALSKYKDALENRIRRDLDRSIELIEEQQLRDAETLLCALRDDELATIPTQDDTDASLQADVYRLLGICNLRLGEPDLALQNLETARSVSGETAKTRKAMLEYYIIQGNHDLASQLSEAMLEEDPTSIEAKNALAAIMLEEMDFESAVRVYKGEPKAKDDPSSQSILSFAYLKLGDLELALEKAQRFTELEPKLPQAQEALGNVYLAVAYAPARQQIELRAEWFKQILDRNSLHKAIEHYEEAHELYAGLDQHAWAEALRTNLANALANDGRVAEALALLDENIESLSQPHVENFILKAQLQDENDEIDDAIETCLRGLELYPNDHRLTGIIGGLLLNKGEPRKARDWLDKAEAVCVDLKELAFLKTIRSRTHLVEDDQDGSWACLQDIPETELAKVNALLAFGDHFFHFKNYSEAESYYLQALLERPNSLGLLDRIVRFYRGFRKPERALDYAERFVKLIGAPAVYAGYVDLLIENRQFQKALSVLERAKRTLELSTLVRQEALCRQELREFAEAARLYKEYLEREPDDYVVVFNLGSCFWSMGQRTKAIEAFVAAERLQPDEVSVHTALAVMYRIEDRRDDAFHHVRRALDLDPNNPDLCFLFFQIAHSCGHEEEAVKVLMEVPRRFPDFEHLKVVGVEEAKEILASSQEQYNQVKDFYGSGNLPLALVAKWLGKPLPWMWRVFSHDRDVRILCSLGTYEGQSKSRETASQADKAVVDYSALLTLHHLGLLELPSRLFQEVYLAQGVLDQIQQDISSLALLAQPERLERLESILDIVLQHPTFQHQTDWLESPLILDAKQERDITPFTEQDVLLAKEHDALYLTDDLLNFASVDQVLPHRVTTTRRILDYLKQNGRIRTVDHHKALDYLERTHRLNGSGTADIGGFTSAVVSHSSLHSLLGTEIVDLLADTFDTVYVSLPTIYLVRQGIGEIKYFEQLLDITKGLETTITSGGGYSIQPAALLDDAALYPEREEIDANFLATYALAEELQLPIWSDDLASRRLAESSARGAIGTFDTRTALDLAGRENKLESDEVRDSIVALLRLGYHFTPINSRIIYWSVEQHSFQLNEETDLLLVSLDESIANAYREWRALIRQAVEENAEPDRLEYQTNLVFSNLRVYVDFLVQLWHSDSSANKRSRSRWTQQAFARVRNSTSNSPAVMSYLVVECIQRMLLFGDDERLDHFLVFSGSPLTPSQPETVDDAIIDVLDRLYSGGEYTVVGLHLASRLVNGMRQGQYSRVKNRLNGHALGRFFGKALIANRLS